VNARYPDFKHSRRKEALWHNSNLNPPWVEKGLATMALGTVQLNIFFLEHQAYKKNKGWRTREDNGALSTNAKRRQDSR
jgi:hypothetical protein